MLKENSKAPDFELLDENGKLHKLSDYFGTPLVLYFYPKDDTPGCTAEACSFRDDYSAFEKSKTKIIGVSPDSVASHKKFKEKYVLPFPLLSDAQHTVAEQYGVWVEKKVRGKKSMGILRTTFLIDRNGNIAKVFAGVKPSEHSKEVLEALQSL